jgi:hypothetical protein
MPYSFEGIGTRFYGERDYGINGSHITTEWFTLLYLPIAPLRSLRILPTTIEPGYTILETTKLNIRQVLSIYGLIAFVACCGVIGSALHLEYLAILVFPALGAPWFLRRRALNRMKEEDERRRMGLSPKTIQ